jgi:hypothetical protein
LFIPIFMFLDSSREDKRFCTDWSIRTTWRRIVGDRRRMNWKRSEWTASWKPRKLSVRVASVPAEIQTEHFLNANPKRNLFVTQSATARFTQVSTSVSEETAADIFRGYESEKEVQ